MALETLKGVSEIGGFAVKRTCWNQPAENFIEINDDGNAITFKLQQGPIKENGINGCQVDTLIEAAKMMIERLNEKFPCGENETAIENLKYALQDLKNRRADRERRGVEGLNLK